MKAIENMNNVEKAYLLAKLFPDSLEELTQFFKQEIEIFKANTEKVYAEWSEGIITPQFWYLRINSVEHSIQYNGTKLWRNARRFSDQLFDGYDALFSIHALIHYSEQPTCGRKLKLAIFLLFGEEKLVRIDLKPQS